MRYAGFVWALPLAILVWLFYIFPFWAFGLLHYNRRHACAVEFVADMGVQWWAKAWKGWRGHAVPCAIVLARVPSDLDATWRRTRRHELRHVDQMFLFGLLFPFLYVGAMVWIACFKRDLHPYRDNPFERDARAYAEKED